MPKKAEKKTAKKVKKTGLGMGMESLIPTEVVAADFDPKSKGPSASRTKNVFIQDIKANPEQPRREFTKDSLRELADSIMIHGVLQPLLVVELGDGYRLIAGERRFRAAKIAGLDKVPVVVRSLDEQAQLEIALIENIQREDLSPLEAALSFSRLNKEFNATFDAIAKQLGKSPSSVNNTVRLLNLPDKAKKALLNGDITEGHARAILSLKDPNRQKELLQLILGSSWSVRRAEQFVKSLKSGAKDTKEAVKQTQKETKETKSLSKVIEAPVRVHKMAKGGRLIIDFKSQKELTRIIKLMTKTSK